MQAVAERRETKKWDIVGIGLSILCAVHCLSIPFLMGVLPMAGLGFVVDHEFEWVMMGIIFAVAGTTYVSGYRRHKRTAVFVFLAIGILIFAAIRPLLPEHLHPIATILGGCVFVFGHWKNWHWHRPSCKEPCCSEGSH